jgi:quinol monooxygenase YgiN
MSDNKVTVLAKITIKPEKNTDAKAALLQLAKNTKSEKGCISYDLHQDTKEDTHINHQNITDFKAATKDAILNLEMNTLEVIS